MRIIYRKQAKYILLRTYYMSYSVKAQSMEAVNNIGIIAYILEGKVEEKVAG